MHQISERHALAPPSEMWSHTPFRDVEALTTVPQAPPEKPSPLLLIHMYSLYSCFPKHLPTVRRGLKQFKPHSKPPAITSPQSDDRHINRTQRK